MNEKKILIVEDEHRIAEILSDYLVKASYQVEHIDRGDKVVEQVKKSSPDLILLDIMLPGMDGLDVCRELRKFSLVPIIIISSRVDELDRLLGLELGADDYICKPFSPREVVARVKVVLRRFNLAENDPQSQGDKVFSHDEAGGRIALKGQTLDLTRTEYKLLSLFLKKPGRVFTRTQLLDYCADQGEPMDRVIDSHIKNLRKKLSKLLADQEVIHAVYGVGYRFEIEH